MRPELFEVSSMLYLYHYCVGCLVMWLWPVIMGTLHKWHGIWIHQQLSCLFNSLFRLTAKNIRAHFLSLTRSKLRLCSANHRAGYFSSLACDWLSIVWAYSEQETENARELCSTYEGNQFVTGGFPSQIASNVESVPMTRPPHVDSEVGQFPKT